MVFKEEGLFQDFSGTLTYSAQDPSQCRIDVTVKAASLDTRNWVRDRELRSDDFFDVEEFPTLSFRSAAVKATGKETYEVQGPLSIHAVTHPFIVPLKLTDFHSVPT